MTNYIKSKAKIKLLFLSCLVILMNPEKGKTETIAATHFQNKAQNFGIESINYHAEISNRSQNDGSHLSELMPYEDFIYHDNIKSVLFYRQGWEFSPPIIGLNSDERLILRFDDLDADFKNYSYTIIHFDATWNPSRLMPFEYIDGFNQDLITEYSFSRNTRVAFTHYYLEFPNANMRPKISGNYILKVFTDGNPDNVVLTQRFMVFEQGVSIDATIKQATDLNYRDTKQEIDFIVNTGQFRISNPFSELKVVITQNNRWDNAIYNLTPRRVEGNRLIYDFERENLFWGGNEFRNFDTRSLRYRSLRVQEISSEGLGWEVRLIPDRNRSVMRYTTDPDINGRFLVKTDDFPDDILESDYTWVYFSLPHNGALANAEIYIFGALTGWSFTEQNRMIFNSHTRRYEQRLLLKQGFYNYKYAVLRSGSNEADVAFFEGSHSVTENNYTILVYYRRPGDLYDSLIGVQHVASGL